MLSPQQPDLLVRTLYEEPVVLCLPSDHRLAVRASVHRGDLDAEDVIAVARGPMPFHEEIVDHRKDFGVELRVVADAFAPAEAVGFVGQTRGVCFLAASSVVPRAGIMTKPLVTNVLKRRSGVFVRQDTRLDQHPEEEIKEVQVLVGRLEGERIDGEAWVLQPYVQVRPRVRVS